MDGIDIYAHAENLDQCGGHEVDDLGCHYHVEEAGSNQFIGCFKAESGCTLSDDTAACDATANTTGRRGPPGGGQRGERPAGERPQGEGPPPGRGK